MAWSSGIGTYIRNTVPRVVRLAPDWRFTILVDPKGNAEWATGAGTANVRLAPLHCRVYGVREQIDLVARTPRDAALFWSTHYNFPLAARQPVVVTIHDVGHLRLPEYTRSVVRHGYAKLMFRMVRRRAAGVLFDSAFSRDEFTALVGPASGNAGVVHLGVDASWFQPEGGAPPIGQPYFVYVGNIKPHKNLGVLLDAFDRVRTELDCRLAIIGRSEHFRTPDPAIRERLARAQDVSLLGELDDAEVRSYVRHAVALISPSLYEGFGLPPLEAMAIGCPAIVSRVASLPEVCGDAAAYFDPRDPSALAELMLGVARDPAKRRRLVERGGAHVRKFDWDATARATHAVLEQAVAR